MTNNLIDIGHGFSYSFFCWKPDRDLNPQYDGIPDVEKAGICVWCDEQVVAMCYLDTEEVRKIPGILESSRWQLISLDPLHIEPSIQMYDKVLNPTYHGYIRNGQWIPC